MKRLTLLLTLLLLTGCAASPGRTAPQPPGPSQQQTQPTENHAAETPGNSAAAVPLQSAVALTALHMVSEQEGWALGSGSTLRTRDGGRHWQNVTPRNYPGGRRGQAAEFLDGATGWVTAWNDAAHKPVVFRTADGGQTWQSAEVALESTGAQNYPVSLSFVDAQRGWLMVEPEHGMNSSPGHLFATVDGGKTWTEVARTDGQPGSLPFSGTIRFRTATDGWLVGSPITTVPRRLFMTQDGGQTWREQKPALPLGLPPGGLDLSTPPAFFPPNNTDGVLVITFVPKNHVTIEFRTVVYSTHDGGKTWQEPRILKGTPAYLNANDAWTWVAEPYNTGAAPPAGGKLLRTHDGGKNWTELPLDVATTRVMQAGFQSVQLDFVTERIGWALWQFPSGATSQLLMTSDGGTTWTLLGAQGKVEDMAGRPVAPLEPQDFGLRGTYLGDQPELVKAILGEPDEVSVMHGLGLPLWIYRKHGLEIGFTSRDSQPGEVISIRATETFAGKTWRGVGIGASLEQVQMAYGATQATAGKDAITFIMQSGKVSSILIQRGL